MNDKRQQIIEVLPYDPTWPQQFQQAATRLEEIFGDNLVTIHHIGSTAIPGMNAKPTIDILPVVKDIELVDKINSAMKEFGFEAWGEYHIPGRRFFVKGEDKRTHHVHVFAENSDHIERHLAFRDYLIANPSIAQGYAELKLNLAKQFRNNRRAYVEGKTEFVQQLELEALNQLR